MVKLTVIAGVVATLWLAAPAQASARGCHGPAATNLFLTYGISEVRVQRATCARAVRVLRRWGRAGAAAPGPTGWRCRSAPLNPDAKRYRCKRAAKRLRFDLGGG